MKSFQNFADNIVEAERRAFGSPSGQDPQGEPMYTRRPGVNEPGRRAEVQKSPKTPTQVKGEIEAAKAFKGIKSGGLETRNVPSFVTKKRQERANKLLGPSPWEQVKGAGEKSFTRGLKKLTPLTGPSKGHQERALRDFINQSSKELGTSTDEIIASMMRGKSAVPFTSPVPSAIDPWKPSETSTVPPKPKPVKQAEVSKRAASYRASQKPPSSKTEFGGTPKSVSFSTPTRSKTSGAPKSSVLDISAKEVPGTKFAEPPVKPKQLPGLSLGQEPAGKMVSVRPGQSQTIKPQQGPGRTGVLGKPKAGQMVGAKIEPVRVVDITSKKPQITGKGVVKSTPVSIPTPPKPKVQGITNIKPAPTAVKIPQPAKPKIAAKTTTNLGQQVVDALKAEKQANLSAKQAEKTAKALKVAKGVRNIGRVAGAAGAGFDAYAGYQAARESGASKKRAFGAGAARAAGGLIGGTIGSGLGSVLGLPGAVAGGIAGYGAGTELATKAYNKLTGPAGKDFKLSDLRKNISSTASSGKKSFKTFVSQLDRKLERYA
jgi:hypothetical protein